MVGTSRFIALALILVALGPSRSVDAQVVASFSVSGTLVDSQYGTPIAAARVRLVELRREDVTHEEGSFHFANVPPGAYTLFAQRIGYRAITRRIEVTGDVAGLRLETSPAAVQLTPTVVTGTLSERSANDVLSPTSVVTGAELDRRLGSTVAATLQLEPGVSAVSMGPATAKPVIRGLSGDRVLVLEDGARPGDLSSTGADHAVAVDPLTAKQFEVVRGPMSLLYGSSALGGVVNIIREEILATLPDHPHGAVTAEGSSANRGASAGAYGATRLGPIGIRGEASIRGARDLRTPIGPLVNTALTTYSLAGSASYIRPRGYAGASYRLYDNDYGIPGGFVGAHAAGIDILMRRHTARAEGEYRPAGGPFSRITANASFTDYRHAEIEASGATGTLFNQSFAATEVVARHEAAGPFSAGAVGVRGQHRDIRTAGGLRTPSTYDYTVAGFVVEEIDLGSVRFQGGARWDGARYVPEKGHTVQVGGEDVPALPRSFGSLSGSLGVLYDVFETFQLGASLSRAYRTPDFNELYSDGPHLAAYSYDVGNPRIGQETGLGLDLFARLNRSRVRAEVATFANRMSGFIFPQNTGEIGRQGGRPKFQHIGKDALLTGAEGDIEVSITNRLVVDATASYVRGTIEDPDSIPAIDPDPARPGSKYLPLIPPLNGHVGIRYETPGYFVGFTSRWADRQDDLGDFETPTAGYALLDATAGVRFLIGSRFHTLTLRADNIADKEYRQHLSRVKSIIPETGRNFSILYRFTF